MSKGIRILMGLFMVLVFNSTILNGATIQTELRNNQWQLIGFMGSQGAQASATYKQDTNTEIFDIADDIGMPSYFVSPTAGAQLTGTGLATPNSDVSETNSSIAIFAIRDTFSVSGKTKLTNAAASAVKMKISNAKTLNANLPRFRMYLAGQNKKPAIRIDYQADYEGQMMRIKFGDEVEDYVAYFNYRRTYINPYPLESSVNSDSDIGPFFADIQDAIDFNTTDNNITAMIDNNTFTIKDTAGVYNKDLTDFSANGAYQVIVYKMGSDGQWENFNSKNAVASSNDFKQFDSGTGYWVKIQNDFNEETGLITTDVAKITDTTYDNIKDGWNLLSFRDKALRYSQGGIFMPLEAGLGIVKLYFGSHGSETNNTLGSTLDINPALSANATARSINQYSQARNDIYGFKQHIRAFPAFDSVSASYGLVIISDTLFEINNTNTSITTLAGGSLTILANGNRGSVYGEYMNIVDFGELNATATGAIDINASVTVSMPKYNSAPQKVGDLNLTDRNESLTNILAGFTRAATKSGATAPSTNTRGYLIAPNFDATTNYADENNMSSMLFAAGARYSLADSTYTKVYKFKAHGKFNIVSARGSNSVESTDTNDTNITPTINAINARTSVTGVVAQNLGNSGTDLYFSLTSAEPGIDILENDDVNLFEDISLTSSSIPNKTRTEGAIKAVYSVLDILNTPIRLARDGYTTSTGNLSTIRYFTNFENIARTVLTEANATDSATYTDVNFSINTTATTNGLFDLQGQDFTSVSDNLQSDPVWTLDFPISGGIIETLHNKGKDIKSIMTMSNANNANNDTYWQVTDLTKELDTLYGNSYDNDKEFNNDYQGVFHMYPNKAYWVFLGPASTRPTKIEGVVESSTSITVQGSAHFSNTFTNGISTTQNHIASLFNVVFKDKILQNGYYNVVAIIGGKRYYMKKTSGNIFQLSINDNEMALIAKNGPDATQDPVFLEVYDGEGLNIIESPTTNGGKSRHSIAFYKPNIPTIAWDRLTGELEVKTPDANATIELYAFPISDISSERKKKLLASNSLRDPRNNVLGWNFDANDSLKGGLATIRAMAKSNEYDFYSDIRAVMYAPIDKGHVLRSYKEGNDIQIGRIPYSFIQGQFLTLHNPSESNLTKNPKFKYEMKDGAITTNGINGGVQLDLLKEGADKVGEMKFAYYPEGNEGSKALDGLAPNGIRTMFLRVNSAPTQTRAIAKITYHPDYEGKLFYVSFNNKLFQGRFASNNNFENDGSSYNLEDTSIAADALIVDNQIQADESAGKLINNGNGNAQFMHVPVMEETKDANTTNGNAVRDNGNALPQ